MRRISILGPVPPYRGGISHHTSSLAEALGKFIETDLLSFSRLYPRWLYPGAFQTEREYTKTSPNAHFMLDTTNPITWHRTASYVNKTLPEAVIIPWWTTFLAPHVRYLSRRFSRTGIPIIFMCHNVVDHEETKLKRWLSEWALKLGTGFIVHSRQEERMLCKMLDAPDVLFHLHPIYDRFPPAQGLLPRRAKLELLFFGLIRPYKGLETLIDAIGNLGDLDIHLSIVGEPWGNNEDYWMKKIKTAQIDNKVEFIPKYIDDIDVAEYFNRADAVVLPYHSATGTGVASIAFQYLKPLIASDVGGLSDLVQNGCTGLLVQPGNARSLSSAIRKLYINPIPNVEQNIDEQKRNMSWENLGKSIITRYIQSIS